MQELTKPDDLVKDAYGRSILVGGDNVRLPKHKRFMRGKTE